MNDDSGIPPHLLQYLEERGWELVPDEHQAPAGRLVEGDPRPPCVGELDNS